MPRKQQFSHLPVKKTGQQNEKLRYEDKFISVTTTPLIKLEHETISKSIRVFYFRVAEFSEGSHQAFLCLE